MQNRYTGDIGDYGKLSLLRSLVAAGLRTGVNWYLTPDETHNKDGRFIHYLDDSAYRHCDPELWEELGRIVTSGERRVQALESRSVLDAVFFRDILDLGSVPAAERAALRAEWHHRALNTLQGCDIVFADPDNGLMVPSARKGKKGGKYVLPEELSAYYQQGASVIYYQHKARRPDSFYIQQHLELLNSGCFPRAHGLGLKFRTISQRYYWFLLQPQHTQTVLTCAEDFLRGYWKEHFSLCTLREEVP